MRLAICLLGVLDVLGGLSPAHVDEWTVIGTVGKWQLRERTGVERDVTFAAKLKPGTDTLIRDPEHTKTGSITLLARATHLTFSCEEPETLTKYGNKSCAEPLVLPMEAPPSATSDDSLTTLFSAVARLFEREPTAFYSAVSRDYGGFDDAVIELRGQSIVLEPAVLGLSKGDYAMSFEPLRDGGTAAGSSKAQFRFAWNPETKPDVTGPDLTPGIYVVTSKTIAGDFAGSAWILVVPSSAFPTKASAFEKVKGLTASWKDDSPAESIRAIQRAALKELAH